jgi:hypothetical protein
MSAPIGIAFPPRILNGVTSSTFRPVAVNLTSRGMFTGNQIVDGPIYQVWRASVQFPDFKQEEWRELSSFVSMLFDSKTPVLIFDPVRQTPLGRWSNASTSTSGEPWGDDTPWGDGTLWKSGGYFNGCVVAQNTEARRDSVLISGFVANEARAAVAGDVIGINGFLYEVASTTGSDDDGKARVNIRPRLREGVLIGDPVTAKRATGSFYIETSADFTLTRNSFTHRGAAALSFIEALP